ncbi:hypothetical protein [Paenibacillus cymbidii]|uniref:hypothetical protein n=1 Tax=Paenibacillus cymbidii TaxID=1639034 RepID=UPI001436C42C|nr:hypothetical protein [Paenibacillus cymbidii]
MLRLTLNASKPVMAEKADDPYIKVQLSEYKYVQRDVMDMNMDWVKVLALFQNGLARSVLGRDDLLTSLSWLATQTDQQLLAFRNARQ